MGCESKAAAGAGGCILPVRGHGGVEVGFYSSLFKGERHLERIERVQLRGLFVPAMRGVQEQGCVIGSRTVL